MNYLGFIDVKRTVYTFIGNLGALMKHLGMSVFLALMVMTRVSNLLTKFPKRVRQVMLL